MLVIGDKATEKYISTFRSKSIEIVYEDEEELDFICLMFKLKNARYQDLYFREYVANDMVYKLYHKDVNKIFKKIFKDLIVRKFSIKYANPFINFIFDSVRVVRMHAKFEEWKQRIDSYTLLSKLYVIDLVKIDEIYDTRIDRMHRMLNNFGDCARYVGGKPYVYYGFDKSTIEEIQALQIVSTSSLNFSPYYRMLNKYVSNNTPNHFEETVFDKFSYQDQLTAILECLYIDTITEFIIPFTTVHEKNPTEEEVSRAFDKCCMYRASQTVEPWIGHFIINNFYELQEDFHISFYDCYLNSIEKEQLTINT